MTRWFEENRLALEKLMTETMENLIVFVGKKLESHMSANRAEIGPFVESVFSSSGKLDSHQITLKQNKCFTIISGREIDLSIISTPLHGQIKKSPGNRKYSSVLVK